MSEEDGDGVGCERCEGTGWLWDDTACGDEDHCAPLYPCYCNPEMKDGL